MALQARLYGPGGCPWDREQTHESLRKFLIEETYEVLDAMESSDPRKFAGELGDLLLQVVFHSILAEKAGRFTISDVIESIHSKMVRRHPHVFGDASAANFRRGAEKLGADQGRGARRRTGTQRRQMAGIHRMKIPSSGGVPRSLPAVLEAYQLTRRASHVGFDWDSLEQILESWPKRNARFAPRFRQTPPKARRSKPKSSAKLEEEVGDLLFTAVNVARFLGVDPEIALKKANAKFKQRFNLWNRHP